MTDGDRGGHLWHWESTVGWCPDVDTLLALRSTPP